MFTDKIKALLVNSKEKEPKKKIENIVVFVIILIITVIAINTIWSGDNKNEEQQEDTSVGKQLSTVSGENKTTNNVTHNEMETRLETILSNIDGVRKCESIN